MGQDLQATTKILKVVPEATVIDLNVDVSEETETPGKLSQRSKENTTILGQIFDKEAKLKKSMLTLTNRLKKLKIHTMVNLQ